MPDKPSRFRRFQTEARALWDEDKGPWRGIPDSKLYKFAHFWVLVWRSFSKNRCPVRASGLAYTTLLALVPMLAVVMSVTSSFLKNEGEERIDHFVEGLVASVIPPGVIPPRTNEVRSTQSGPTNTTSEAASDKSTNSAAVANAPAEGEDRVIRARKEISHKIHEFIKNTQSGALGVTGGILVIFAAIGMLTRIEDTMNDIWGVA